ncbi:MAG: hypothetical protein R2909_06885 [Gemmatimonadales bacterium]
MFGTALFLTMVIDEAAERTTWYERFRELTAYPRFYGECLHSCHDRLSSDQVLRWVEHDGATLPERDAVWSEYGPVLRAALPVMRDEVVDFFAEHMPDVDGAHFSDGCLQWPLSRLLTGTPEGSDAPSPPPLDAVQRGDR